jgi:hypothetical protein
VRRLSTVLIAVLTAGMLLTTAPPAQADIRCSGWVSWEYGASYFVVIRSCINHSASNVTGKTEVFLDWNGIVQPQFTYVGLVTTVFKNGNNVGSDVCDRTPAANNPTAHNSAAEAMVCLVTLPRSSGTWQTRSNVCVDGAVPNTSYRCISETAFGLQWSPTHPL